jgi:hypothetical protein
MKFAYGRGMSISSNFPALSAAIGPAWCKTSGENGMASVLRIRVPGGTIYNVYSSSWNPDAFTTEAQRSRSDVNSAANSLVFIATGS